MNELGLDKWRKMGVDGQQPFGCIVFLCALAKDKELATILGKNADDLIAQTNELFAPDEQIGAGMLTSALPAVKKLAAI